MIPRHVFVATILWALSASCAQAEDVLELRDGRLLRGTYMGGTQTTLRIEIANTVQVLPIGEVMALTIGSRLPQAVPVATPVPATASVPVPATTGDPNPLPIGTVVLMRTKDPIDSRAQGPGSRFSGTLEGDLVLNGVVVVARGAMIYGELKAAHQGGRLLGKTELVLVLTGILIDGQIHPCTTTVAEVVGDGQGKDTATKVAAGALVGGAVDGKSGAQKGAMVGGAAALLTRGGAVKIPPGTLLQFQLEQPFIR